MSGARRLHLSLAAAAGAASVALVRGTADRPLPQFTGRMLLAGAAALLGAWLLAGSRHRLSILVLVVVAVAGRLVWIDTQPVREDDFYRYLWDGQVLRLGIDPYRYAPLDVLATGAFRQDREAFRGGELHDLDRLEALRDSSPEARLVFSRISHAELPTIYPPLSLAVFSMAGAIAPFRLEGLRWTFLLFDLATIALLVSILHRAGRPVGWAALYAWQPLVAKEFVNSAHHDAVAVLALVTFLWLWQRGRLRWAAAALALSVLGKLFALALVPIYLASIGRRKAAGALGVFAIVLALGYLPFLSGHMLGSLPRFVSHWTFNEGAFGLLRAVTGDPAARLLTAALVLGFVFFRARGVESDFSSGARACGAVLAAIYLLSPVPHPWYATWFLPFLALFPFAPLLLLAALAPLYCLLFFAAENQLPGLGIAVRWAEYAPVWIWLFWAAVHRDGTATQFPFTSSGPTIPRSSAGDGSGTLLIQPQSTSTSWGSAPSSSGSISSASKP